MSKRYVNLSNLLGAFFLQAGNFLVPIALLPILISSLGISGYGTFSFIYAVIQYFILLTDWGFILYATRQVSLQRYDRESLSQVFWTAIFSRLFLCGISYILLELGCLLFEISPNVYRWAFLVVFASAISPIFFFQGQEQLGKVALINTLIKFLIVPVVWLTVNDFDDLTLAISIYAIFNFLASLSIFVYLLRLNRIDLPVLEKINIFYTLKDSSSLFISTAAVSLYTNSNTVILGLIVNPPTVGIFSSAMLIIRALQGIYQPVSQVFFPKISHAFSKGSDDGIAIFRFLLLWQGSLTLAASVSLFIFGPQIMMLLIGEDLETATSVILWLSPLIFLTGLSNIFGIQGMVSLGYNQAFKKILLISGVLNIGLAIPMSFLMGAQGTAISVLLTELVIAVAMGWFLYLRRPLFFKNIF